MVRRRASGAWACAFVIAAFLLTSLNPMGHLPWLRASKVVAPSEVADGIDSAAADDVDGTAADPVDGTTVDGTTVDDVDGVLDQVLAPTPAAFKVPDPFRIAVVGTGVDPGVFPAGVRDRITIAGGDGDALGHGTWAVSVVLQQAPGAEATVEDVYSGAALDARRLRDALTSIAQRPDVDAVLLAFPPSDLLDPVTASMTAGEWDAVLKAANTSSLETANGPVFGIPTDRGLLARQVEGVTYHDGVAASHFADAVARWNDVLSALRIIQHAGVPVVSPAGDTGALPQSIEGLAGLPEVITVAAFDGETVAARSSAGPSVHGGAKPDVVAPPAAAGLLPPASALARALAERGLVDAGLHVELEGEQPPAARTAAVTSIPAAATVATIAGSLHAQGVGTVAETRGLLMAAAHPIAGVPVWRQGAGILTGAPSASDLTGRPVLSGPLDLGAEPAKGEAWIATRAILHGAAADAAVVLTDHIGTSPTGGRFADAVTPGEAPAVATRVGADGVTATLPAGDNPWEGGIFCGYTTLTVPVTGQHLSSAIRVDGAPEDVEHVPTCLVEGVTLEAWNFYIHDLPAENLTFSLLPSLVPGVGVADGPVRVLPVNPLHTRLYSGVSGADGFVRFTNIPPSYYLLRQHGDYGAPTVEQQPAVEGAPMPSLTRDLGQDFGYMSYDALTLPNPCAESIKASAATGTACHDTWLRSTPGVKDVAYDKVHSRYLVTLATGHTIGVVFEFTKKMQGTSVTSRYIDLVDAADFTTASPAAINDLVLSPALRSLGVDGFTDAWRFQPNPLGGDSSGLEAVFTGLPSDAHLIGMADYKFAVPTPNFSAEFSLNFRWQAERTTILVGVQVGAEIHVIALSPAKTVDVPRLPLDTPVDAALDLTSLADLGSGSGVYNFQRHLLSEGASEGLLRFAFIDHGGLVPGRAEVSDISFELASWSNTAWPPTKHDRDRNPGTGSAGLEVPGHSFRFDSGISERQYQGRCRGVRDAGRDMQLCEDWQVILHSGLDDVETFDVVDSDTGERFLDEVAAAGGAYYRGTRGRNGVSGASARLVFEETNLVALENDLSATMPLVTNGRFWEQLVLPAAALAAHPGEIDVLIQDNLRGGESTLLPHRSGPVPLSTYLRFITGGGLAIVASPTIDAGGGAGAVGGLLPRAAAESMTTAKPAAASSAAPPAWACTLPV